MQYKWKSLPRRLAQAVTLMALLALIQGVGRAQTLAFQPGLTSVVAGNLTGNNTTIVTTTPTPVGSVVPAADFVGQINSAVTDSSGNIYFLSSNAIWVVAFGNDAIPALPGVSPQAGYIYTVAGTGVTSSGNSNSISSACTTSTDADGDGCLATQALVTAQGPYTDSSPANIAVDSNGNIYMADQNNCVVRVVYGGAGNVPGLTSPLAGYVYAIAGQNGFGSCAGESGIGGSATSAEFYWPQHVGVDSHGNIYITDSQAFNSNSTPVLAIFAGGSLPGITDPTVGDIYTIVGYTGTDASGIPAASAILPSPASITFDASGNVYIPDGKDHLVHAIYVGGSVPGLTSLTPGDIYTVAGSSAGQKATFFTPISALDVGMQPTAVVPDSVGNLYISDLQKGVYKVDPFGNLTAIVDNSAADATGACPWASDVSNDGCAADAGVNFQPDSIGLDPEGDLYLSDTTLLHELSVSTSSLYFTPGQTQPIVIYNTGTQPLTLTSVQVSSSFEIVSTGSSDCSMTPITLPPGKSCKTSIEFPSGNAATGTLTVASNSTNASDGTNTIQLTGESAANAALAATTLTPDFQSPVPATIPAGTSENLQYQLNCNACTANTPVSGTATLYSGNTVITSQSISLTATPGTFTFNNVQFPTGNNFIYATYGGGDSVHAPSQSTEFLVTVNGTATTTTVTASPTTVAASTPVTLTATVALASGATAPSGETTPSGKVNFYSNGTLLGPGTLGVNGVPGQATLSTSALPAGADSITAIYGGDDYYSTSTSTAATVNVGAVLPATTTALTASASTLYVAQPVTFTATVTAYPSGTPNGNVSFMSGSTLLGIGQLDINGVATLTTSTLAANIYNVTAVYQGNSSFASSTSSPVKVTVVAQLAPSSTTLALSSTAVAEGQNVTFTATVGPNSPITPSGNVSFMDGNMTLGQGTLYGGIATFSTTALAPGNYSVTAAYGGDGNFSGSTSSAVALAVAVPTPSFTLSSTPTNLTLTSGQSGAAIITLVPTNGYAGTITLSCGTLPTNVTCSFSPATLTADGKNDAVQSTLTISTSGATTTTASSARAGRPGQNGAIPSGTARLAAFFFLPSGLLLWGFAARKKQLNRYLSLVTLALLTVGLFGISGCGGGNGGSTHNAATGASTITITGTGSAGSQTQTVNLAITIQ